MRFLVRVTLIGGGLVLMVLAGMLGMFRWPDATWIAFTAQDGTGWALFRTTPDGDWVEPVTRLTHQNAPAQPEAQEVAWSPDGQWIAFVYADNIYRVRANGSALTQITQSSYAKRGLTWSPDGQTLMFVAGQESIGRAYQVAANGSGLRLIDSRAYMPEAPRRTASPDGAFVTWTYNRGVFRAETTTSVWMPLIQGRRLTDPALTVEDAAWSPEAPAHFQAWRVSMVGVLLVIAGLVALRRW